MLCCVYGVLLYLFFESIVRLFFKFAVAVPTENPKFLSSARSPQLVGHVRQYDACQVRFKTRQGLSGHRCLKHPGFSLVRGARPWRAGDVESAIVLVRVFFVL